MKDKDFWKIHLKWGVIFGLLLIFIEILKMFARKVDYQAAQLLDLAMIIGIILVLFYGVREYKDYLPERLSFAKAFRSTLIMSLIAALMLFCYDLFHYSVIEKDGLQQKYNVALSKYKTNLSKDTVTTAELTDFIDSTTAILDCQKNEVLSDIADNDTLTNEIESGILIFQKYYSDKLFSKPEEDRAAYQLGGFNQYARRVLIETLVSYIEQNKEKESTPYVQRIIQNTNSLLESVNPLDIRFEKNKHSVPHYEKNGNYAAISALIYLLYGMFFGIFVAMFHYRSKNAIIDEAPIDENITENEENEDQSTENQ